MLEIKKFSLLEVGKTKSFSDEWVGKNYFSEKDLNEIIDLSIKDGFNASFLAIEDNELVGIRLTYAPGSWVNKIPQGLSPNLWKVEKNEVAYFKSLFIKEEYQGKGLGKKLSYESIKVLLKMGAKAIVCHSWIESPNDSSRRYLKKMGFEKIKEHPLFWSSLDYECVRCTPKKCACTALEMIKYL